MNWLLVLALLQVPTGPSVALPNITAFQQDSYLSHVVGVPLKVNGDVAGTWSYSFPIPAGWTCEPFTGKNHVGVSCSTYPSAIADTGSIILPQIGGKIGCVSGTNGGEMNGNPTWFVIECGNIATAPAPALIK